MTLPKLPALPAVPAATDPELQQFLLTVKSVLDNLSGANGGGTAAMTAESVTALVTSQAAAIVAQAAAAGSTTTPTPTTPIPKPPAALSGLTATGGFANVMLEWSSVPGNSAYTVVYRAAVDDFSQATPIGTSRFLLYVDYVPNYQDYYYWITTVTDEGLEGPPNSPDGTQAASTIDAAFLLEQLDKALTANQIATGGLDDEAVFGSSVIGSAAIKEAAIVDAHVLSLGADKIVASSLSAISANMGQVTAGLLRSPDGTFTVDLDDKEIVIAGPNGVASDTYTIIRNGQIETWLYDGSVHTLAKSLTHIEVGTADNNSWVEIPGSFINSPKVMVSPHAMRIYDASYPTQNQVLRCQAIDLQEITAGSKRWKFKAVASLELEGSNPVTAVNHYPAASSSTTITCPPTGYYTTQSNTTTAHITVFASSVRGYGTPANQYYARKVAFNVYARLNGTSNSFVQCYSGSYINLPQSIDPAAVLDCSFTATFASTNRWDFYVTATYADTGGSFTTSAQVEETATDTISGATYDKSDQLVTNGVTNTNYNQSKVVQSPLPTYSPPSGWTVTNVAYAYQAFSYVSITGLTDENNWTNNQASAASRLPARQVLHEGSSGSTSTWTNGSFNLTYYDKNALAGTLQVKYWSTIYAAGSPQYNAQGGFRNVVVTITRKKALTNSTTQSNIVQLINFTSNTSGATILATGSLNWVAVG